MASQMPRKIDVHSHFLPEFYQEACRDNGHANPDGSKCERRDIHVSSPSSLNGRYYGIIPYNGTAQLILISCKVPYLPTWDETTHLALMDSLGIQKSILSISSPGTHLVYTNNTLACTLTRRINSYASTLKSRHPHRFGYFASLPIPDIEGSLLEIPLALSEGCDGFVLLTNSHGTYLGDPALDPIFDELNRRKALIFIHPTTPKICPCSASAGASDASTETPTSATPFAGRLPNPMQEFFFDTARVVANLFMSGTIQRCPDLRIILPHLGGAFPPLLSRWTGFSELVPGPWEGVGEEVVKEAMAKQIWFDMAGFAFPGQIKGLMLGVGVGHERLMYGSDYPFTQAKGVELLLGKMEAGVRGLFTEREVEDLYYRNAEKMLGVANGL